MPNKREIISVSQGQRPFFVGVDVGGTNTKLGLVDDLGRTLAYRSIATDEAQGPADAIRRIHLAMRDLVAHVALPWDDVAVVGLGTPGSMDIAKGMILEPPNMPNWRYFPVRDRLSEACNKPVAFANDANAAAYGEFWVGRGREFPSMVMFTLGTGVGGGIILNGRSVDGENSFGSELGHLVIDCRPDARLCVWGGGRGQLEAYASAPAVVARAREALAKGRSSLVRSRLDDGVELTPLMLAEEAEKGDAFSLEIILETARLLAVGIVNAVHTVDPGAVILGGAMHFGGREKDVGRRFLDEIRSEFQQLAYHVVAHNTTIDFATLGGDAGYIGAAGIGRANHLRTP